MTTYHEGNRELQDRRDTRRLADRLDERVVRDVLLPEDRHFLEVRDMFFLATADASGQPTVSYKGGDPGVLHVVDLQTVAFPDYDGNGMFFSLGNVLVNPKVGLLLVDFASPFRIRLEGTATLHDDDELLARWPGAQCVVRVHVTRVYPNCPRYVHRMEVVEPSPFVPHEGIPTPVPDWKTSDLAEGVLPAGDPALGQ